MAISLTSKTRRPIEERLKRDGYPTADDVVSAALELLDRQDELDDETLAAIDRAEEQIERGEYHDRKDVSADLRRKYLGG